MKHLFYSLFLILLCIGCNREDDIMIEEDMVIEEEFDSSSIETRAGDISLVLSGTTVSIIWVQPFGQNAGIRVEVYREMNGSPIGTYTSDQHSGSGSFSVNYNMNDPVYYPLTAIVRAVPRYGVSNESITVSVLNTNNPNTPDPNVPCYHSIISGSPSLGIEVDPSFGSLKLYRTVDHAGLMVVQFSVGCRTVDFWGNPMYDGESMTRSTTFGPLNHPGSSGTNLSEFFLSMNRFADNSSALASLEVRIYDRDCQKLAHSGYFPACKHYYKYQLTNVPLNSLRQTGGTMSVVRER